MLDSIKKNLFLFRGSDKLNPQNQFTSDNIRFDDYSFPASLDFFSSDTKERFENNLITQPADWQYRTQPVEYIFNKHGFRTKEFEDIDFSNSVFLFGCSETMGTGLDETETISYQLEKKLGVPVINLARNGTSMHYSFVNNLILKKICKKPIAVINHWTSLDRLTYYGKHTPTNLLPRHAFFFRKYYGLLMNQLGFNIDDVTAHHEFQARLISENCKLLWDNTIYVETSWNMNTAEILECYKTKQVDHARDIFFDPVENKWNAHSGVKTASNIAEFYASKIKL
jgi:hypothetical protein